MRASRLSHESGNMENSDRRLRSLDSFLLFMTTIFGLFFSLISVLLTQKEIAYGFFLLLIIGLVIPIYIGYVRGAIILDTLEERVRGWIYFLYGVIVCIISIVLWNISVTMSVRAVITVYELATFGYSMGILVFIYVHGARILRNWLYHKIFKIFNSDATKLTSKIYSDTGESAVVLGIFLWVAFIISMSSTHDIVTVFLVVVGVSYGVASFALCEHDIRKWIELIQFSEFIELEYHPARFLIPFSIAKVLTLISLLVMAILLMAFGWVGLIPQLGLVLFGWALLIGVTLLRSIFVLSVESQTILVKKKEGIPKDVEQNLTKLLARMKI